MKSSANKSAFFQIIETKLYFWNQHCFNGFFS